ncbi:MAG: AAA family ATPase [Myxococcota bacterium]
MLIGLTGKYAAGKGTVAEALKAQGFGYHSCSDILREELRARGVAESRESLLALGNELRRAGGPGELARRLTPRLQDGANHIVDSIRNPAEVEALRTLQGFVLIAVDASPEVRFTRLRARARIGDPETYEAFQALEARELASDDPTTQQLTATIALADHHLQNDAGVDELHDALTRLLTMLGRA